ncbi:hypothetical protein B0F87_1138 [Methylobacter tundripaludum]|uniref:HicA-like toxin of HicAB toxin-antitoxin system n=1 Tax=Methylobacter tundripaludum TaxID=173365 RepID=A0A2S6H8V1_9GAMM|nr:hypothetical protein [Methylobacter tundripaludum]PPK73897.1 hypothetical protein B0F87_1138 [Methylobacter tundripaludum]
MNAKLRIANTISELQLHKASLCCGKVKDILVSLGFEVSDGNKGGHKVFTHQGLPSFHSGGYNCGHGKNPEIKPTYIGNIIRILKRYQDELEQYLE